MRLYGLIGYPLGHSRSAELFAERFAQKVINAEYHLYELASLTQLQDLINQHPNLHGLNVTAPYKSEVLRYTTELSPEASAIGAANVLSIHRTTSGLHIKAYNTDAYGFAESLRELPPTSPALILGTGGAARAVAYALQGLGIDYLHVSRTPKHGEVSYAALSELMAEYRLIVNATPVGYRLSDCPPIPYELLTPQHFCYDLIYNPAQTAFLAKSAAQGARTLNGLSMLRLQAEAAWRIWSTDYWE